MVIAIDIHAITDCNKPVYWWFSVRQDCEAIPASFVMAVSAGEEGGVAILCSSKTFAVNWKARPFFIPIYHVIKTGVIKFWNPIVIGTPCPQIYGRYGDPLLKSGTPYTHARMERPNERIDEGTYSDLERFRKPLKILHSTGLGSTRRPKFM